MIATDSDPENRRYSWILSPNRALGPHTFAAVFILIALAAMLVALVSAWHGNVFAPVFATVDVLIVAVAWRAIWRSGERAERIDLDAEALSVHWLVRGQMREVARFHPQWVRLSTPDEIPGERCRLILRSHGRSIEIGRLLGAQERLEAAASLRAALAGATNFESSSGQP